MTPSEKCFDLVKFFESCRLEAYPDSTGIWTIGWGHTKGCCEGLTCTQEQADSWLPEDLADAVVVIEKHVKVPLNQNQFDALVSFVYNVGPGKKNFKQGFVYLYDGSPSTMLKKLNIGDFKGASLQFPLWNKAGGKVLGGLTKRRKKEQELFDTPVSDT